MFLTYILNSNAKILCQAGFDKHFGLQFTLQGKFGLYAWFGPPQALGVPIWAFGSNMSFRLPPLLSLTCHSDFYVCFGLPRAL